MKIRKEKNNMFNYSKNNFKKLGKDAVTPGVSAVNLVADIFMIPVAFVKDVCVEYQRLAAEDQEKQKQLAQVKKAN